MVRLRFLKVFEGAARPADDEPIASPHESLSRSTSFDEFIHPFAVKPLQWEQEALKAELYDSIFRAFSKNNNLPPEETAPAPAATTGKSSISSFSSYFALLLTPLVLLFSRSALLTLYARSQMTILQSPPLNKSSFSASLV